MAEQSLPLRQKPTPLVHSEPMPVRVVPRPDGRFASSWRFRLGPRIRERRLRIGRNALGRPLRRQRRADRHERRQCRGIQRLLHLPRAGRGWEWRRCAATGGPRCWLSGPPADRLCGRTPPSPGDAMDRRTDVGPRQASGLVVLCRHAERDPFGRSDGRRGHAALPARKTVAGDARLRGMPWRSWRGKRAGQSSTGGSASRLSCRSALQVAPQREAERPRRRYADHQPAPYA